MHIAVNGKAFGTLEKGGSIRVALRLVEEIAQARPDFTFEVYIPIQRGSANPLEGFPPNVRTRCTPLSVFSSRLMRSIWEQFLLPRMIRCQRKYDLLVNFTNSAPVFFLPGVPQILLVHDSGFLNQEWFSPPFSLYLKWLVRTAAAKGVHLVTVSKASAIQLGRDLLHDRQPSVIRNASDDAPIEADAARLGFPYVLFLGSLNPRKNIARAIAGFRLFKESLQEDVRLVVVGARKPIFVQGCYELMDSDDVVYMGYVDEMEKWSLLKGAELLLLPSLLEGFGIPVLEALKARTPVVASDIPVFRELYGDAVEYVDPYSPEDIGRGICRVFGNLALRERLVRDGKSVADSFSWAYSAQEYIRLFEDFAKKANDAASAGDPLAPSRSLNQQP